MTGPTIIEAPMWLLVPCGILAWLCYFGIVIAERRRHRLANDPVEHGEADGERQEPRGRIVNGDGTRMVSSPSEVHCNRCEICGNQVDVRAAFWNREDGPFTRPAGWACRDCKPAEFVDLDWWIDSGDHARSVAHGPVDLPPGIPSIIERLDRWDKHTYREELRRHPLADEEQQP